MAKPLFPEHGPRPATAKLRAPNSAIQQEPALNAYLDTLLARVPDIAEAPAEPPTVAEAVAVESAAGVPEWAQTGFQALFFKVHGIVLATPLLAVRRVQELSAPPSALPESPSWLLGLLKTQGETIGILHTAELVMGVEKLGGRDFAERPYRHILHSRHGRYGFACDEVLDMGKLHPTEVAWRNAASIALRPWLVGTVPGRLCALVDLERLAPLIGRGGGGSHNLNLSGGGSIR
ncbi:MAG TPA: chemotaxis protein CheW [Methylococcaceae bacterium]|nr:chemotaxis protein CheW [Methylococcaceae bacterium]